MDRILTLHFKYREHLTGQISDYEPFATAAVKDGDTVEFDKTNEWLSSLMELKIAHDPSIAGVYISDEVEKKDKPAKVEVTKTGNVIQFTRGSKDV